MSTPLNRIQKLTRTIRYNDWWNYKVPPLLALAYLSFYWNMDEPKIAFTQICLILVWILGAAGFGHYLNDLYDIDTDRKAGKFNSAAGHTCGQRSGILILLLSLIYTPWIIKGPDCLQLGLVSLQIILFLLYSAPWPRLKEKGFVGLLVDALYGHALPAIIIIAGFSKPNLYYKNTWFEFISPLEFHVFFFFLSLWSICLGLRNIIGHQLSDYNNDLKAGIQTYVVQKGPPNMAKSIKIFSFLEVIAFIGMCLMMPNGGFWVILLFLVFVLYRIFLLKKVWRTDSSKNYGVDWQNSFLNNFYEQLFPFVPLIMLAIVNPWYLVLFPVHFALFPKILMGLGQELKSIWKFLF